MEERNLKNASPILIVGVPRSGTTLLQLMINAHPNIAIYGEINYFNQIVSLKKLVPSLKNSEELDKLFAMLDNMNNFQYLPYRKKIFAQVKSRLETELIPSYEKFYIYVLEEYAKQEKANIYGDKTPNYVRYLKDIRHDFPDAKIIHIVRDPRAVVASLIKTPFASDNVVTNALKWKINILSSFEPAIDSKSKYELLYESLIFQPEIELTKICTFIGEKYNNNMLNYYQNSKKYNIKDQSWSKNVHIPVTNTSINKWEKELSKSQIFIIEKIVGSTLLSKFGYSNAEISIGAKLISPFVFVWEIMKHFRWKYNEIKTQRQNSQIIYTQKEGVYRFFFRIFFNSKL